MKKKVLLVFLLLLVFCAACSKSVNGPKGPETSPSAAPTQAMEPTTAPAPTAVPTPTPIPVLRDVVTESSRECVYEIPMEPFRFVAHDFDGINTCEVGNYIVAVYPDYYSKDYSVDYEQENSDSPEDMSYSEDEPLKLLFICEIKNLITNETKRESFTFDTDSSSYIEMRALGEDKFVITSSNSVEHRIYDIDFTLQECFSLELKSEYDYFDSCWNSSGEFFFLESGGDTLLKKTLSDPQSQVVMKDKRLKDAYGIRCLNDDFITAYKSDYVGESGYIISLKSQSMETIPFVIEEYYISDDGSELMIRYPDKNYFEIYDVEQCPLPLLNPQYEKGKEYTPKAAYHPGEDITSWTEPIFDWSRRLMILTENLSQVSTSTMVYSCYGIDDGKLYSSFNYLYEDDYFYPNAFINVSDGLFMIQSDINCPVYYAWDYTAGKKDVDYTLFTRTNYIPRKLDEKRKALEDKYNIYVYLGPEIGEVVSDYIVEVSYDYFAMEEALDVVDKTLSIYPEGFLDQIKVDGIKTLGIYFCAGLTKNGPNSIDSAIAVATSYGCERLLMLDLSYSGDRMAENIIHEISHWIDKRIEFKIGTDAYNKLWNELNPKNFSYCFSYVDCRYNWDYIYFESKKNSYFLDSYSQTYPTEDRARLFEYLMYAEDGQNYFECEHIRLKIARYFELIRENFNTDGWPELTEWEKRLKEYEGADVPENEAA